MIKYTNQVSEAALNKSVLFTRTNPEEQYEQELLAIFKNLEAPRGVQFPLKSNELELSSMERKKIMKSIFENVDPVFSYNHENIKSFNVDSSVEPSKYKKIHYIVFTVLNRQRKLVKTIESIMLENSDGQLISYKINIQKSKPSNSLPGLEEGDGIGTVSSIESQILAKLKMLELPTSR